MLQIWLCLFTCRPIASKQLNCLTTINSPSLFGGAVVTHPHWVPDVPGSIPASGKDFFIWFFVFLLLCLYFLSKNSIFVTKCCDSFWNNDILQDLWPIIRVYEFASLNVPLNFTFETHCQYCVKRCIRCCMSVIHNKRLGMTFTLTNQENSFEARDSNNS